ncbi:uncharacterized protein LOC121738936 isoform X2 [Aricia agestis]|nr:uncharacterized protein LOC121738936 isoform X2 [Aricia agestis]XP_041987152.1 uncharacterized protein LOC121738936 isoform X2 [Aricia agestis]
MKPPLEGEITAEDIIRATTPIRSMSREFSRSRTQSPDFRDSQRILNLNSSPGSSRKHNEEGQDEGVHVPNFSKEISLDSEDDPMKKNEERPASQASAYLVSPSEKPKSVSPKSILKRRVPEQQYIGVTETREKTKCCHPLVNKIKHLADKTLQKLDRNDTEKSPTSKRKKAEEVQEIRQLRNSPSAVKRQKFSAIKLGSSDEMSKTMSIETPPPRMRKDHIYEDIEEPKDVESSDLQENLEKEDTKSNSNKENDSLLEKKSMTSQDPSLVTDDNNSLKNDEHIMEKLHIMKDAINKEAILLDEEMDQEEPNVDEVFQNQVDDSRPPDSPNITITEMPDDDENANHLEQSTAIPIETSPSPSPREHDRKRHEVEFIDQDWSKPSSDHEYEIIEKPPPNIIYTSPSIDDQTPISKTDDELSSTTSLERKCLQHTTDDEDQIESKGVIDEKSENVINAEALQKDIEDRFFVNTPSTMSRTECEVSTSQVDSSALENLPLKRENRNKTGESLDSKIQQRFREGTGKLKTQAGKLRTKLNNLKTKQFSSPERTKINSQEQNENRKKERPKLSFPERPKFTLPDRRKFSLPDRPKFKKINLSEKLTFGDKKKFTMPERPKFNIPDLPKFKMPEKSKQIFSSLGRKKNKPDLRISESSSELNNVASVEFEAKTYPRLFNKKKKNQMTKTSSSPTLNREDTPPPVFTFTRMKKTSENTQKYIPDSPEHPREYGALDSETSFENEMEERKQFETTYDFDKVDPDYVDKENEEPDFKNISRNASSIPDMSPSIQEYTHINEINNDEFFVRPRGISRENIQVREYLSDEIRQAFNIPKNVLASMGSTEPEAQKMYVTQADADPELTIEENEQMRYSVEDLNERDDGYYTFPPIRPSRAKRKKKEIESIQYMDESVNASMQFSEVDLGISEDNLKEIQNTNFAEDSKLTHETEFRPDLNSIHEYANDDIIEYPDNIPIQSQTLPMPPKRKKKYNKNEIRHSYSNDFNTFPSPNIWQGEQQSEDIIVYRTEHEYIVPHSEAAFTEQSPVPPRRSRSRSSKGTSICDDDRTSHGAESLTLDTHLPQDFEEKPVRQESPGYATVDKGSTGYKQTFRSKSKTPPLRRRKSNSSERKYYTVSGTKNVKPNRPPRKKSSSSLMTLDSFNKNSIMNGDTQYDEIEEPKFDEVHKDLKSGPVVSKMKDRPLPPPPRPPRGPKRKKDTNENMDDYTKSNLKEQDIAEIEVSTQTDTLPDDVDFELGIDDHLDISMSSSLRDIIDEESIIGKASKPTSPHISRPSSRSEKSLKLSDPKMAELSKSHIGRTSPTVILVEKRVSSPTRINERDVILTEASLTVQPIDIDESKIPEVPPLPKQRSTMRPSQSSKEVVCQESERALERVSDTGRDVQLDNLVTQRLQVKDLDVGRLNVSELQASKILVSEIEGMTLNVNEFDSKTGNISVSGLELSQSVIDEIVKKFAEISTSQGRQTLTPQSVDVPRPVSREEETQTEPAGEKTYDERPEIRPPSPIALLSDASLPPQRPPPPDLTPLLLSYLQDVAPTQFQAARPSRERPITEFFESQFQTPHPPTRRSKRKLPVPQTESSSEDDKPRPSPRRMPPTKAQEPTITEAGAQFLRVCQNSISRTLRNIFNTFMSYISRAEDKKDVQMAMVIFLVLIAGLIMLGLSDSRTIHHHHWEFFNPPDTNK